MPTGATQFHSIRLQTVGKNRPPSDADLAAILDYRESDAAVSNLIGVLAARGLLSTRQCKLLMGVLPCRFMDDLHAYEQVHALLVLRDDLRTPLARLVDLLQMGCDWAALLVVGEIGPYHCGRAFQIINDSDRPSRVKSDLCAVVAAHQASLWADI